MKRTTKRYVVTTSALNCYGYRVLTEGVDFTQFEKNPILLWMHQRAYGNLKNQILPLGRAVELKREGDQITCYLEFDETDDFAMQVYNKYENGTLSMVSLGALPIEISEAPEMMLQGQIGPTITKCKMTDLSCVDMGGNDDALPCQLYDTNEKKLELSGLTHEGMIQLLSPLLKTKNDDNEDMKLIQLSAPVLAQILLHLKLEDTATEVDVQKKVADLVQLSANQATSITTLTSERDEAKTKLDALEKEQKEAKNIELVNAALNDGKIMPVQKDHFIKLAGLDYDSTKATLDAMPKSASIAQKVEENKTKNGVDYAALSYDDLDKKGMLIKLKADNLELFKAKFKERFNKDYNG